MRALLIIAAILAGLYFIGSGGLSGNLVAAQVAMSDPAPPAAKPYPYSAEIVSLDCLNNTGLLAGVLRNTGSEPIAYANVQVKLGGEIMEAPVIRVQPGQIATFGVANYANARDCSVIAIRHEKDGRDLL